MIEVGLALLIAMLAWWLGTGLILYVDGLPRRTYRVSMAVATGLAGISILGLYATRADVTAAGAYTAFFCALGVWAWHELGFLTGWVTGPRRSPCPPDAAPFDRFLAAVGAVLHHQIAIAAAGGIIAVILWSAPNQVGLWTYLILWIMRISAKLNLFLGVPCFSDDLLPPHLAYVKTYFRRAPMNPLFPVSVTGGTMAAAWLAHDAWLPGATAHETVGGVLLATLLALAVLEHWLMVLPVRESELWRWAQPAPEAASAARADPPQRPADASVAKNDRSQPATPAHAAACD